MGYDNSLIWQYMMNKESRLKNDVIQLGNNITFRNSDPLDHLEMIMAQTRLQTATDIFDEIALLLKMIRKDEVQ